MAIGYPKPKTTKTFTDEAGKLEKKPRKLVEHYTGRHRAPGASSDGDGLMSKKHAAFERMIQKPQNRAGDIGEDRGESYENGSKGWSRGGPLGGEGRPGFDTGKLDIMNKPQPTRGPKCEASGVNAEKSPFSAAHKSWQEK